MSQDRKCVSMVKGRHRYVFWYDEGQESETLSAVLDLANDPRVEFDWFDAAVLSYQIGRQAELEPFPAV